MKRTPSNPSEAVELRRRAEARFSKKQKSQRPEAGTERAADDTKRLVQELQIHQIELEIQNEQLEQARAETQEALELYTDLYDFAPSGYFTLDRDGTIRQVNLTGSELLRVDRSRLVNRRFGLFVAENSRLAFQVFAEKVFASQSRETCEAMLLREDNPPFYARIEARSSDNGQECRAVVVDITERKEAEEEIRRLAAKLEQQNAELSARNQELFRSEQKLLLQSTALETAANAVVITDTEGIIRWVNPAFVALTGYTSEEVIGKTPRLLNSGQHDLAFYKTLWTTLLAGSTWRSNFTNRRKDGSLYHDEHTITPVHSKDGKITHFIAIMSDVTDRRQAEEALREREAELREAQRLAKVGSWKLAGDTVTWSEELHCIFGHDPALPAPSYSEQKEIIAPESWARLQVAIERATKTGTPYELDLEIVCSDGKHKWITARGEAVRDEEGRITALRGTAQDITERKRAEEEILRLNAELERRVIERTAQLQATNVELQVAAKVKDLFLANMSHELRTPLNGIIGYAEFLVDGKPGTINPKQKECLEDILNSGKHLLQLISDILDLAKVGAGKIEFFPERFSLRKAIEEACAVAKPIAQKKHIPIDVNVAPEIGDVTLDQQKFKQVIYNLLSNAIKFSHDGGKVEIRVAMHDAHRFKLAVVDNGIGINEEDLKRLFMQFEQIESGASRHHEGTGLGLALTRKIVELQGGRISVESEFGKGSTFTVVMPLVMAEVNV